ncbi:hypothetical protein [Paraburkholderia sp. RL17-347-BIC-D]|uniref:hypothetical protein n=1 Tax=Paraburkholderia sp. RL17-347-BIC-D TaxID=3031632 RepID=UPI0038B96074
MTVDRFELHSEVLGLFPIPVGGVLAMGAIPVKPDIQKPSVLAEGFCFWFGDYVSIILP